MVEKKIFKMICAAAVCGTLGFQVYGAGCCSTSFFAANVICEEVKASSFGFNRSNSTKCLQQAFNSGAKRVVVDKQEHPWISGPLAIHSDTEVVFEEGVVLKARRGAFKGKRTSFLTLRTVSNVVLRAVGKGAVIKMDGSCKCPKSGHQHGINILSSSNVAVSNLTVCGMGGDGIYIGTESIGSAANRNVIISDCVLDDNYRQGISVISVDMLLIERTVMKNTKGASPKAGIDFEPNSPDELMCNIVMRDCVAENNDGVGFQFYPGHLSSKSKPMTVTMENCHSIGNARGAFVAQFDPSRSMDGLPVGGFMNVRNCRFSGGDVFAMRAINKPFNVMDMRFENCIFDNNSTNYAVVGLDTLSIEVAPTDGVVFDNVEVRGNAGCSWISSAETPWTDKGVYNVSGNVDLCIGGGKERIELDEKWRKKVYGDKSGSSQLEIKTFDPTKIKRIVDLNPGKMEKFTPLKLRFSADAIIYASKPGKVSFSAYVYQVSNKKARNLGFKITDMQGNAVASLPFPGEKEQVFTIDVPKTGFYRIAAVVKPNAIVFTGSDSPMGIVPPQSGLNVFMGHRGTVAVHKSKGNVYFTSNGAESAFLCGGNRNELLSANLFDVNGEQVAQWKNIGNWGFYKLNPVKNGLWRAELKETDEGYTWEDSYIALLGKPTVFFLSNKKYWED